MSKGMGMNYTDSEGRVLGIQIIHEPRADEEVRSEEWMCDSPKDFLERGKRKMLDGREPETEVDWQKLANYLTYNVEYGKEHEIILMMKALFNIPLDTKILLVIAAFQRAQKSKEHLLNEKIKTRVQDVAPELDDKTEGGSPA